MKEGISGLVLLVCLASVFFLWKPNSQLPKIEAPILQEEISPSSHHATFTTDDGMAVVDALVEPGLELNGLKAESQKGYLALGIANNGDYAPLRMDEQGYLLFNCVKCPNKMCKELACNFTMVEPGNMAADCICREAKP